MSFEKVISYLKNSLFSVGTKIGVGRTSMYLMRTYVVYAFVAALMIITKIVIARAYGQEELGVYSYFFALASFIFLLTSFELPEALTQLIVKQKYNLKQVTKLCVSWIIVPTILLLTILLITNRFFGLFADYSFFSWALVLFIASYTIYYSLYSILRGYKQFAKSSAYSLVWRGFFIIGILLFALWGLPFWLVLMLLSACILIAAITMFPAVMVLWKQEANVSYKLVSSKKLWKLAFALFLVQVGFYSLRTIDIYFLELLLSFTEVGYYSAYASFTNVIRLLAYVFPVVVLPMAAVSKYKIHKSLSRLLIAAIPFAAIVWVFTVFFVPFFYGSLYSDGFALSLALVASSTILLVYSYSSSIFAGENDVSSSYLWILGIDFLLSLIGNSLFNYYLILRYGIIGAPIATGAIVFLKVVFLLGAIKWFRYNQKRKGKYEK